MPLNKDISTTALNAVYVTNPSGTRPEGRDIWTVLGVITSPALILVNAATGEKRTEVIGCPNAEQYRLLREG